MSPRCRRQTEPSPNNDQLILQLYVSWFYATYSLIESLSPTKTPSLYYYYIKLYILNGLVESFHHFVTATGDENDKQRDNAEYGGKWWPYSVVALEAEPSRLTRFQRLARGTRVRVIHDRQAVIAAFNHWEDVDLPDDWEASLGCDFIVENYDIGDSTYVLLKPGAFDETRYNVLQHHTHVFIHEAKQVIIELTKN